jgi:hypothetical protein
MFAAQDHEVAREAGHDLLHRECQAGAEQARAGGKPCRIVEPDGNQSDNAEYEQQETDSLAGPEGNPLPVAAEPSRDCSQ